MAKSLKSVVPESSIEVPEHRPRPPVEEIAAPEFESTKLHNGQLEFHTMLRLIVDPELRPRLWGRLSPEHFAADVPNAIYSRVKNLVGAGREWPSLATLAIDPALPPAAQAHLGAFLAQVDQGHPLQSELTLADGRKLPLTSSADYEGVIFDTLDALRIMRSGVELMVTTVNDVANDKSLDALKGAQLVQSVGQQIIGLQSSEKVQDNILHFGHLLSAKDLEIQQRTVKGLFEDGLPRFKTGFELYDQEAGGFQPGEVVLVGANTGAGKSGFLLSLMTNMTRMGTSVAMLQLELGKRQVSERLSANLASIDTKVLRTGKLTERQRLHIEESWQDFHDELSGARSRFTVFSPSSCTLEEVEMVFKTYPYKVWFIDYVNLLAFTGGMKQRAGEDHTRLSDIIKALKAMAKKYGICIVCAIQVNIDKETGDISIRYAKAMGEHADVILAWHLTKEAREDGVVWVRHLKARQYDVFDFPMRVALQYARFESFNPQDIPDSPKKRLGGNKVIHQAAEDTDVFVRKPRPVVENVDNYTPPWVESAPMFLTSPESTPFPAGRAPATTPTLFVDQESYDEYDDA